MGTTPLLELSHARVVRDGSAILDIDSLVLRERERVAMLGPNGAGKSTLLRLLTRDVRPIAVDGRPPVLLRGRERWDLFGARRVFGIVSNALQDNYDRVVRVRDVVLSGYFGSIGLYRARELTTAMRERAEELLEDLGIAHLAARTMDTLSTGEARRTLIARALVHDPAALVLDEPCDGLDPGAARALLDLMRRLSQDRALVLVTHHIEDIVPEIDRVVMLREGRIVADGPKAQVLTEEGLSKLFGVKLGLRERDGYFRLL